MDKKIKNMIQRCMISLFLINFSFLLFANDLDCDSVFGKKEYGLKLYLSIKDETVDIVNAESETHDTIVLTVYISGKDGEETIHINKGKKFTSNNNKGITWAKIISVDGEEPDSASVLFKPDSFKQYREKTKENEKLKGENETSKETIKSEKKEPDRTTIILDKELIKREVIHLKSITNNSDYDVYYNIIDEKKDGDSGTLGKGKTQQINKDIRRIYVNKDEDDKNKEGRIYIWEVKDSQNEWDKSNKNGGADKITNIKQEEKAKEKINKSELIKRIEDDLEKDTCWSKSSIKKIKEKIEFVEKNIRNAKSKEEFAKNNGVNQFIEVEQNKLVKDENINNKVEELISNYRKKYDIENVADCKEEIKKILSSRNEERYKLLEEYADMFGLKVENPAESPIVSIVVIVLIVIILIVCLTILSKKKKSKREERIYQPVSTVDTTPNIVVRKTSSSVLKKQSLDDVINNNSYYLIESVDFCDDSTVRRIYIKNTCVKEIYEMYAEDLRNPNNPKEDGCMVLGRWIYDEQANEYNVSLEEIVRPGDDAIFQEYELNFGGKIKLRVAERLRKLRKESNLQYDLTCWVHSHPGLGVFFSNSDSSVQMQLKHSTHPNFLTAIVVDILTPEQEFGIFTFKRDSSINSRNDLKKMYSLEDLYKWAVESDRNSYKPEDHYNVLLKAENVCEECQKIMLSNSAIIDISAIVVMQNIGLVGLIYGYQAQNTLKNEYVICSVENKEKVTENELLGCLIIGTHCSIPSIKKAIVDYTNKIKFVMFYSLKEEAITTIPITNMELCMEEKYYSEEKLNDLKIWTRRKR